MLKELGNESAAKKIERSVADMAVPRAKKKKKSNPQKTVDWYIHRATYLQFAVMVRNLMTAFDYTREQMEEVLEGHLALLDEIYDGNHTVEGVMKDAKELSGIDSKKLVDELFAKRK